MKKFGVKNLRSLKNTGLIDLKPLTIIVGRNSSGKSTFLRSFPLIRQSVEANTTGPILWYGDYVDFGSFEEAVNSNCDDGKITFDFEVQLHQTPDRYRYWRLFRNQNLLEDTSVQISLDLVLASNKKKTIAKSYRISFFDHEVEINFRDGNKVSEFIVNGSEMKKGKINFKKASINGLFPTITEIKPKDADLPYSNENSYVGTYRLRQRIERDLKKFVHANTSLGTIRSVSNQIPVASTADMLEAMKQIRTGGKYFLRKMREVSINSKKFKDLIDVVIAGRVPGLIHYINDKISNFASGIQYIAPLRARTERYYRFQNLSVDEVDFQGKNLPMFLHNLTNDNLEDFKEWTKQNLGFSVYPTTSQGHISLVLQDRDSDAEFNLTDVGFGVSQLLPIIAQLWMEFQGRQNSNESSSIFAMEQPELHLHPSLQAKLADLISLAISSISSRESQLNLIIETHSDHIINRIGHNIARGNLNSTDVQILVFNQNSPNDTEVTISNFDDEGILQNWPFGFFEPDI